MERPSSSTWVIGGPLGIASTIILIVSVFAYFGEWWWALDIVANFRVQLVAVGIVVIVGGVTIHTRSVITVGILVAVVNLIPIVPLYAGVSSGVASFPEVRVASYNLQLGTSPDIGEVIEWLQSVDADVVFLHEADVDWVTAIERADLPYRVVGPMRAQGASYGTMALVRAGATVEYLDITQRPAPVVSLDVNGERVVVLGVHTVAPYDAIGSRLRDGDLLAIADWVNDQESRVVVAGDLNATPFSWSFRRMLEVSGLRNSQVGHGLQATWPTHNMLLRVPIDHLLYSDGLWIWDRSVHSNLGSDHFPIVVDLSLAPDVVDASDEGE